VLKVKKNTLEQDLFEIQQTLLMTQNELSELQENNKREIEQMIKERKLNEQIVVELTKEV